MDDVWDWIKWLLGFLIFIFLIELVCDPKQVGSWFNELKSGFTQTTVSTNK